METKITKLRNIMNPIVNYFAMQKDGDKRIEKLVVKERDKCIKNIPEIVEILKQIPDNACENKKIKINLNEYNYSCSDGCCDNFGTKTTINGTELPFYNQDAGTIVKGVLEHLEIDAEVTISENGKEIAEIRF